ncbi:PaaI family thioesterase [Anaerobacillus alkaliphilus]|uniref:PaaI family thioesterase n=1 Tax=Anaerobacillus alkaliphilus TaxID=1548597 RepID=A0A4Q0VKN6_9BACI|nr:PaaI family thioesterase [Anaerobacillus alkaliphilus]RXI95544.1 PaaI family thioesterase [Anaerobacillus alkaliphilus]
MDKDKLRRQFEHALENHQEGTGQLFLYSFLNFEFEYDEDQQVVRITAPISEVMYNPIGFIHGGMITYLADTAMGHLCAAFADRPGVSLELKTQFMRSAKAGTLHAEAYFIKKGKQVQFVECTIKDDKNELMAKITGTFFSIGE